DHDPDFPADNAITLGPGDRSVLTVEADSGMASPILPDSGSLATPRQTVFIYKNLLVSAAAGKMAGIETFSQRITATAPEPASWLLLGVGLWFLWRRARRPLQRLGFSPASRRTVDRGKS
ncbi:MAG TPA: PEP-CTERM sorting domain-containing protein, partial [Lamprocystis sp. (in: g-proteobacteria)]|nr:PEP-CTERM sorting domain-containing protein [Lamprocystis sp. (in: g-proteobacteria)]